MAIKYVAIDSGKFATKAVTLKSDRTEKLLVFRTRMEETNRASAQGTSFLVEYEGKMHPGGAGGSCIFQVIQGGTAPQGCGLHGIGPVGGERG